MKRFNGAINLWRCMSRLWIALGLLLSLLQVAHAADEMAQYPRPFFSPSEKQWIRDHPVIHVLAFDAYAPMSFIDKQMNFSGVSADLLTLIRIRTGLNFVITDASDLATIRQTLASGHADMVAGIPVDYLPELHYSRVWLTSRYVLLTRSDSPAPTTLDALSDKFVAVREGTLMARYLSAHYARIKLVRSGNLTEAVDLLSAGDVDAAIGIEANTDYQIERIGQGKLQVTGLPDVNPLHIAFGVTPTEPTLLSIINKVLATIPDNEYQQLGSGWRYEGGAFWQRWRQHLWQVALPAALVLVLSLLWGISLRRQVRQRTRMQLILKDQLACMYNIMHAVPWPMVVRNLEGRVMDCNTRYLDELKVAREKVLWQTIDILPLPEYLSRELQKDYYRVLTTGLPVVGDRLLALDHSTKPRTVFHWIVPFHGSDGAMMGAFSGWIDVTERQELVQQLNVARDEALASSRAKTNFLSVVSHEIRTPLNAILGILELQIKQNVQAQRSQPMLEVVHDAAKNLLAVVGDILDIARIESGRMAIEPKREDLIALTRSVVLLFQEMSAQKQLSITLRIVGGNDCVLKIDPYRYKQILSNLLSNAIKFTHAGGVEVILAHQPAGEGMIGVSLTVRDTGIGIAPEDQKRLFKPFTQLGVDDEISRQGTGLGLFICRTLCDLMKGTLTLTSTPGEGTSVCLQLRLPAAVASIVKPESTTSLAPLLPHVKRVLIVDDYPPNLMLLRHQLEFLGHQVSEAQNGEEALTLWHMYNNFDYVLIDCNMPVMDGFTLAKRLRAEEKENARARAVLLGFTAIAQEEVIGQCRAAGMDGCLFKPCSQEEIGKWIK